MFTTDLVNLYNRNIFKTSLYIYIFQDRNLSLSTVKSNQDLLMATTTAAGSYLLAYVTPMVSMGGTMASYSKTENRFIMQLILFIVCKFRRKKSFLPIFPDCGCFKFLSFNRIRFRFFCFVTFLRKKSLDIIINQRKDYFRNFPETLEFK